MHLSEMESEQITWWGLFIKKICDHHLDNNSKSNNDNKNEKRVQEN